MVQSKLAYPETFEMSETYTLVAKNTLPLKQMDSDDRAVVGTYSIGVEVLTKDAVAEGDLREAILDQFHDNYGIEVLDDLDIRVFSPTGVEMSSELNSEAPDEGMVSVEVPEKISDATTFPKPASAPRRKRSPR
jgi:hypothetical protein